MAACHRMKDNLRSLFSSCWKKKEDEHADELRPLIRREKEKNPLTWREFFKAMKNRAVYPLVRTRTQNILLHHLYCRFCPESASKSALSEKGAKSLYKPTIFPLLFSSTVYFQLLWFPSL